jgi:hypothetical protein
MMWIADVDSPLCKDIDDVPDLTGWRVLLKNQRIFNTCG